MYFKSNRLDKKVKTAAYIRKGSAGVAVVELQKALNNAGAEPHLDVDGVFGAETQRALKRFQERHKLEPDGIAGPKTFDALKILDSVPASA